MLCLTFLVQTYSLEVNWQHPLSLNTWLFANRKKTILTKYVHMFKQPNQRPGPARNGIVPFCRGPIPLFVKPRIDVGPPR